MLHVWIQPIVAQYGLYAVFVIVMLESAGLPLPGETHGTSDPAYQRLEYARTVEFLRRELGVPGDAAPQRP